MSTHNLRFMKEYEKKPQKFSVQEKFTLSRARFIAFNIPDASQCFSAKSGPLLYIGV